MIKLLVPTVPTVDQIFPYLQRIDEAKWYTNFGQLVQELEARLAKRYGDGANVVTTSSCTAGLELAFELSKSMGQEKVVISPLTFQATALAANRVGLRVVFQDPDPDTWLGPCVSAFGVPNYDGSPVIDAAAAFGEQQSRPDLLTVFSMHATKPLPAGEGGYIVTHDAGEASELRSMSNFGFLSGTRTAKFGLGYGVSRGTGTNAKLSEYHAAVALASLDMWDEVSTFMGEAPATPIEIMRARYLRLFDWYEEHLPAGITKQKRERGVYPILAVLIPEDVPIEFVMGHMRGAAVETRRWYTPPLHRHPLFSRHPSDFPVAERLSRRLIGLPWHLHLTATDVAAVCHALERAINNARELGVKVQS